MLELSLFRHLRRHQPLRFQNNIGGVYYQAIEQARRIKPAK